jgi:hypothetical protein
LKLGEFRHKRNNESGGRSSAAGLLKYGIACMGSIPKKTFPLGIGESTREVGKEQGGASRKRTSIARMVMVGVRQMPAKSAIDTGHVVRRDLPQLMPTLCRTWKFFSAKARANWYSNRIFICSRRCRKSPTKGNFGAQ